MEYILIQLLAFLSVGVMWAVNHILGAIDPLGIVYWLSLFPTIAVFLGALFVLLTASSQQCRDANWPGWAVLFLFLPLAGTIFYFLLLIIPGTPGSNSYGPAPNVRNRGELIA